MNLFANASIIAFAILLLAIVFAVKTMKIVPQQHAWVIERLGKYDRTLTPGLNIIIPFIDRVAYKHVSRNSRSTFRARSASRATTPS